MINGMAHFVGEGLISKIKEDIIYFFVYSTSIWLEFSYTYICVEVQLTHFISVTGSMDMYLIKRIIICILLIYTANRTESHLI